MREPIGYVVRAVTGDTQLSNRFVLLSGAREFAANCAMPVRIWRIVHKKQSSDAIAAQKPRGTP